MWTYFLLPSYLSKFATFGLILILASLVILVFFISLLLLSLIFILNRLNSTSTIELRPFECGFSPSLNNRNNFSIQFFLVALIFLIFDIELILLFPILTNTLVTLSYIRAFRFRMFLTILTLGLFVEWAQGILEWKKFRKS